MLQTVLNVLFQAVLFFFLLLALCDVTALAMRTALLTTWHLNFSIWCVRIKCGLEVSTTALTITNNLVTS